MSILLTVHIDGASRGNPGPSGIGIIIFRNNTLILSYGEFIGFHTNLLSEYLALKRALQFAVIIDKEIRIHTDSMTIIQHRKSKERIRRKELKILSREIKNLEKKFKKI
ncbi:MAG: RNase H family protein, partial [Nitrososphaeraceae archaeon]